MTRKWGKTYWADFGERVGTTAIYGLITLLTLDGTTGLDLDQLYPVVLLPAALSALKALLMNLSGDAPTASLAKVTSSRKEG